MARQEIQPVRRDGGLRPRGGGGQLPPPPPRLGHDPAGGQQAGGRRLGGPAGLAFVVRSTPQPQLTAEGLTFHEQALRVLAGLDEAERSVASCAVRGRLRINSTCRSASTPAALIPRFTALHPEVRVGVTPDRPGDRSLGRTG
ncbi:hypothetical protein ACRAWD_24220 [Caulobacter segnis]